ncbi:hypothetical protein D0Z00_003239 [Geotrichum galactomycetum]|uniref:Uncharacterized protein n=1 Tax=Geotrichum galactomycetum TaxID=27317 RepID=A0ACB6V1T8_9ASCO|nr:hypothetical protein D0Z00_003239 [Geotrichum candidum]
MDTDLLVLPREDPEWQKANEAVNADPDNLELWETLIETTERLQSAASRQIQAKYTSAAARQSEFPQVYNAIKDTTRVTYDRFLERFVLLFGYWIKYAELEVGFAREMGDKDGGAAGRVYERSVAAFPASVDLWVSYLSFLETRPRVAENVRRGLFERGADLIGRDFLSHPFWDKYIDFEEHLDPAGERLLWLLAQIVQIPLHQYARYYEKFVEVLGKYKGEKREELIALAPLPAGSEANYSSGDVAAHYAIVFQNTQQGTNDRWLYESKISRSYFHVLELEQDQVDNWNEYLRWEIAQGDVTQTRSLFERALVPAALYDSFWLMYIRWTLRLANTTEDPTDKEILMEEVRNIFRRATTTFVPIARPFIRYQYGLFEESQGEVVVARDIFASIQKQFPDQEEPYIYRVDFEKRVNGNEAAIAYIDTLLQPSSAAAAASKIIPPVRDEPVVTAAAVKSCLSALQGNLYASANNAPRARTVFKQATNKNLSSRYLLINYLEFELREALHLLRFPSPNNSFQAQVQQYVHPLWANLVALRGQIPPYVVADLSRLYADFLDRTGPAAPWAARTAFGEIDTEIAAPFVKRTRALGKLSDGSLAGAAHTLQKLRYENGHPGIEINPIKARGQENNEQHLFGRYFNAQNGLSSY